MDLPVGVKNFLQERERIKEKNRTEMNLTLTHKHIFFFFSYAAYVECCKHGITSCKYFSFFISLLFIYKY